MLAPTAGVWSYLAWIKASALACVKSGADLQPLRNIPAPRNANAPKTTIFTAFFTFPPYTAQKVSKLARIAIFLLLSSEVNGVESAIAHSCQFFALEAVLIGWSTGILASHFTLLTHHIPNGLNINAVCHEGVKSVHVPCTRLTWADNWRAV